MAEQKDLEPPDRSKGDVAHAVVRAGIAAVPLVGGSGVEIFTALVSPPLEKRRNEWMEQVGEALRDVAEAHELDLEALREDDAFLDSVLHATQVALRNSASEKRKALRNAVLNVALDRGPDDALREMFIAWIDEMTVWHLRILDLFRNPPGWFEAQGRDFPEVYQGALSTVLVEAYPVLQDRKSFYDQVWEELRSRGLVNTNSLHALMSQMGISAGRVTPLGEAFLKFIQEPD